MTPLWITIRLCHSSSWRYRLETHFAQPIRTGTKRECSYDWHGTAYTFNEYGTKEDIPSAILDLVKEASINCGMPSTTIYRQFLSSEIALKISDQGVTVFKPYDKSKTKVQGPASEASYDEMPTINDTLPAAPDVFTADIASLI